MKKAGLEASEQKVLLRTDSLPEPPGATVNISLSGSMGVQQSHLEDISQTQLDQFRDSSAKLKEVLKKIDRAAKSWLEYHRDYSQKNTVQSYLTMSIRLLRNPGDRDLQAISTEDVQGLLIQRIPLAPMAELASRRGVVSDIKESIS